MASYFDDLVLDLTYLIVSYISDFTDINKLINCSGSLKNHFKNDDAWKTLFYHNIKNPVINTNILWRDNYFINLNPKTKYKINQLDTYDYLILNIHKLHIKGSTDKIVSTYKSTEHATKFILKFIITGSGKVSYVDNFNINDILKYLFDVMNFTGVHLGFEIDDDVEYEDFCEFFGYFSHDIIINKTFQINDVKFGYKVIN